MGSAPLTTLDAALAGVMALGFYTAPLSYFIERHPTYVDLVREVVRRVDVGTIAGYTSAVTLTEVLTKPREVGNTAIQSEYRSLLLGSRNLTLVPIDALVAECALLTRCKSPPRWAPAARHS